MAPLAFLFLHSYAVKELVKIRSSDGVNILSVFELLEIIVNNMGVCLIDES